MVAVGSYEEGKSFACLPLPRPRAGISPRWSHLTRIPLNMAHCVSFPSMLQSQIWLELIPFKSSNSEGQKGGDMFSWVSAMVWHHYMPGGSRRIHAIVFPYFWGLTASPWLIALPLPSQKPEVVGAVLSLSLNFQTITQLTSLEYLLLTSRNFVSIYSSPLYVFNNVFFI